jgi:hypothetical protein
MKKIITICAAILLTANMFAQSPNKMSYQAVIRNASNALVTNQAIGMRISILQNSPSGTAVYVETQTPTANTNGLASIEIGGGTIVSGNFASINWANGPYFVKTETDPSGGNNYTISGTSQLLSVPYALFASQVASSGGASQWLNGSNNSIYYKKGISRVGVGLTNPNAGLDVRRIGDNNLGTIFLANFESLDTTGNQGFDHGAFVRMSTNDYRGRLDLGGSQFNAPTTLGSILHTTGGWQWNTQLNIMGNVGIGTNSPARTLHVNSVMRLEPIAIAPTSPAKGDMYFDSTLNKLRVYDGTSWQNCW